MTLSANTIPQRFYSLDTARGLCSLSVVFWHWKNLFFNGVSPGAIERSAQPLYSAFFPFYEKGYLAVDLFFCLSGFLFFWLYSDRIIRLEMQAKEFFWLRFSRLYPLHLCMLLAVLLGQQLMLSQTGSFFVYPGNDAYHFALNVFLATDWGMQRELSYNVPVWSVSIEILLYSLFFIICRKNLLPWCWLAAGVLIVLSLTGNNSDLGRGLFSFFAGGLVYHLYARIAAAGQCRRWALPLLAATAAGVAVVLADMKLDLLGPALTAAGETLAGLSGSAYDPALAERCKWLLTTGLLFPTIVLALVVVETAGGVFGKRLAYLGDLSYSIYLVHFPLQIFYVYGVISLGLDKSFFYTVPALMLFMALLLGSSICTYQFVECPARRFLRGVSLAFPFLGKSPQYQVQRAQAG
jgi:peptidoglycan/LPS O-acetylase OafA/YrhL